MQPVLQVPSLRVFRVNRDLAILLLLVAVGAVPFLGQPFHMDDTFYMDMARNARAKPFFPNDTPYVFEGRQLPDMGSHSHPPLQTYFLCLIQILAGEGPGKEWIYHLAALIFAVLAVLALYFVAARFVERPIWPSALLACCPLFMVMQHTLMTDVPTLALWLAGISCFLWASDLRSRGLFALSSIFQLAAMFTSYQSAALTPLLGFYHFRKRGKLAGWLSVIFPPIAMALWFGMNYLHYGRFLLLDTFGYVESRHFSALAVLGMKLAAILQYQGWLVVFPLFLLYILGTEIRGRLLGLVCLFALCLAQIVIPAYRILDKLIFVLGITAGTMVLIRMLRFMAGSVFRKNAAEGWDPANAQFLGLWYFGVFAYCTFLLTEGSARYILPLVPPFLIVYFRHLEVMEAGEYRLARRPALGAAMAASGSLVLSLGWGLMLSQADFEFARVYPQAARESSQIIGTMKGYYGGEWGFRYYFQQAGMRQLPGDDTPVEGGSWLVHPKLALPYEISASLNSMTMPTHTLSYEPATPVRLLDWRFPAGFYSTGWGWIPFSLSRHSLEVIELRQVNFLIERLPWAKIETSAQRLPWPGYVQIHDKNPLALLLKSETKLRYQWEFEARLDLQVLCGISDMHESERGDYSYEFFIRQLDGGGHTLVELRKSLRAASPKGDPSPQPIQLSLSSHRDGAEYLELGFRSNPGGASATGAFAEAVIRPSRK